ncbi:MAG: glucose-6-phosphate dehydrogenase [Deltaproteobacteria bacterium]|nr:glucose-6-phosphate dehydrogenase [Deltaproteobacteria bacterium]
MNTHESEQTKEEKTIVKACAPDLGLKPEACLLERRIEPCVVVIPGAPGDLTARMLFPAIFHLFVNGGLPDPFAIVGCGRTWMDDEVFRNRIRSSLEKTESYDPVRWQKFAPSIYYRSLQYDDLQSFQGLADSLKEIDRRHHTGGNRIFYFALPPSLYKPVARHLGQTGLGVEGAKGNGWSRIVVEKPFGYNLESAVDLDRAIHEYFKEHQIFRIDHYLAKETVQNILMFRFANSIFEPLWNRRYVDHVSIRATETLGVENRAGYYERSGILRDMFQNHMMQLLSLIAMEPPSIFEAERVRDEKAKVYRSLRPFPVLDLQDYLVLGQYGPGIINGERIAGYREEKGVEPDSLTPTFAVMKLFVDNWRWQGVPFVLTSGKRLKHKITEIAIQFKPVPHSMFRRVLAETITANQLTLGIYPEEKITMTFQTKNPGAQLSLRAVTMDFDYRQSYTGPVLDAYEKVLIDCMLGDQMLFWRQDGVELCWSFLTPILEQCEECTDQEGNLHFYPAGSHGPEAVRNVLKEIN